MTAQTRRKHHVFSCWVRKVIVLPTGLAGWCWVRKDIVLPAGCKTAYSSSQVDSQVIFPFNHKQTAQIFPPCSYIFTVLLCRPESTIVVYGTCISSRTEFASFITLLSAFFISLWSRACMYVCMMLVCCNIAIYLLGHRFLHRCFLHAHTAHMHTTSHTLLQESRKKTWCNQAYETISILVHIPN